MKRIQNKIAESRLTLSATTVYGILISVLWGMLDPSLGDAFWQNPRWYAQLLLVAVSTALMVQLNNGNVLIRIYSRMVSCSFLVLTIMSGFLFKSVEGSVVMLSFIVFYYFFLRAHQDNQAVGSIFIAFLSFGVGSLFFVQLLYFLPLFWVLMGMKLQALSVRTFFASVLGVITPYWLVGSYYVFKMDLLTPLSHFMSLADLEPLPFMIDPSGALHIVSLAQQHGLIESIGIAVTIFFVLILTFTGIIHFLRHSSSDRLRTQMVYEFFILATLFIIIFLFLQPQHHDILLRLLIINTAPLIGHFFALTHTRTTNVFFIVTLVIVAILTAFHLICFSVPPETLYDTVVTWISSLSS